MSVKKISILAVKSAMFAVLILILDEGLSSLSFDFERDGNDLLAGITFVLHLFITTPGHGFAGNAQAIDTAMFIFWMAAYFVVGLAHPVVKRYLQKPSSG